MGLCESGCSDLHSMASGAKDFFFFFLVKANIKAFKSLCDAEGRDGNPRIHLFLSPILFREVRHK